MPGQAQITESPWLNHVDNKYYVKVHLYMMFSDQNKVRDLSLSYQIDGESFSASPQPTQAVIGRKSYFEFIIDAPYNPDRFCLLNPIVIPVGGLSWWEGYIITTHDFNENVAQFYGDSFITVKQERSQIRSFRNDDIVIDQDMEKGIMYLYDSNSGLSTRLDTNLEGECIWEENTQDRFQHVGNYTTVTSMPNFFLTEAVLVRKSAYRSYRYTYNSVNYGDLQQIFAYPGYTVNLTRNDVFHACAATSSKDDDTTIFDRLREVEEGTPWPTGCSATRSICLQSYRVGSSPSAFDGLVGHFRLTLKPKEMTWKAESWIELDNSANADGWATFCTPYNDVKVPRGLQVLIVDGLKDKEDPAAPDYVNMVSMADHPYIPRGTGVMAKGYGRYQFHGAEVAPGDPTNSTVEDDRTAYAGSNNLMKCVSLNQADEGNINHLPYSCTAGSHFVLTASKVEVTKTVGEGATAQAYTEEIFMPKFVPATKNSPLGDAWDDDDVYGHIPLFKSYLCINIPPSSAPVRELVPLMAGETQDIYACTQTNTDTASTVIYDLAGRRVTYHLSPLPSNLKKGLYIINGKKCIVK